MLATLASGVEDPVIIRVDTPKSVIRKIILEHNNFHSGAPNTYVQRLLEIPRIESKWEVFKRENGIRVRTCAAKGKLSYESRFWTFIEDSDEFSGLFVDWHEFDNAKVSLHKLMDVNAFNMWEPWRKCVGKRTHWNSKVLLRVYDVCVCLIKLVVMLLL